ncbi:hypothetical protein B484DRAFT_1241 [Ochromonadaceae sp. CCMP2298]|nr:hypothetical protein B484DRAFT_1241 [Ochromonadaceae sp. CCMP2298]
MFPLSILLVVALLCVGSSLHLATQGAFKGLVRALSRREADVGATNTNGEPPLLLLDTGADPQTPSPPPPNAPSAAASADAGAGAHIRLWTWLRALPPRLRSQYRRTQEAAAKAEQLFTEVVSEIPELASPPLSSAESHALYVLYSGYVLVFLTLVVTVHLLSCWGMRLLAAAETVGLGGLGRLRGWAGMVNSSISPIPRIPLSPLPQPAVAAPSRRGGGDEGGLVGRLEAPELLSLYRQHTALVEQAPYLGARRSWCEREAALEMQCEWAL